MQLFGFTCSLLLVAAGLPTAAACPFLGSEKVSDEKKEAGCLRSKRNLQNGPNIPEFECETAFSGRTVNDAVNAAKDAITTHVEADRQLGPKFVRLGFHDCVGGCNGSVDMEDFNNQGLQQPIDALAPIAKCYASELTRADVWALAAVTSAEMLQRGNGDAVEYPFEYYGRPSLDNPTQGGDEVMPTAHVTIDDLLSFFEDEFGFDAQETVAIMGAHTLGGLSNRNSGFRGRWVRATTRVDNKFYELLLDGEDGVDSAEPNDSYFQQEQNNGQFIWQLAGQRGGGGDGGGDGGDGHGGRGHDGGGGGGNNRHRNRRQGGRNLRELQRSGRSGRGGRGGRSGRSGRGGRGGRGALVMLNADMALVSNFAGFIDSQSGLVKCVPRLSAGGDSMLPECPTSSTLSQAATYASDNLEWLEDFRDVLTKMTLNVGGGVALSKVPAPEESTPPPILPIV